MNLIDLMVFLDDGFEEGCICLDDGREAYICCDLGEFQQRVSVGDIVEMDYINRNETEIKIMLKNGLNFTVVMV